MSMKSDGSSAPPEHDARVAVARAFDAMNDGPADTPQGARVQSNSTQQPLLLALAALAIGYVLGTSLPMGRRERDSFGPLGDSLASKAKSAANDVIDDAKQAAINAVAGAFGSGKRK